MNDIQLLMYEVERYKKHKEKLNQLVNITNQAFFLEVKELEQVKSA